MLAWKNAIAFCVAAAVDQFPVSRFLNPGLAPMVRAFEREVEAQSSLLTGGHFSLRVRIHDVDNSGPNSALTRE
jgi:hypothetical protein